MLRIFAATVAALFLAGASADDVVTTSVDDFSVVHRSSLPAEGVTGVAGQVSDAQRRVLAWLGQSSTWSGPPYDKPMRVLIDPDTHTPSQMRSTIFVPEARVLSALEQGDLASADLGIVHEVTHVLAASAFRKDRDRFYDDGLAVYLQHRFGPAVSYPTFGKALHVATANAAAEQGGLLPLSEVDQARRSTESPLRLLGYLQAGSFTQFLVDNFGIDAYFRIYQGEDIAAVTGQPFSALEERWRALIQDTGNPG
ncbi:hypothetical protein F3N42_00550 [Marinihelvus fidelis]|uniref:Uncharacterized protein n=1 Tax=Marinihelvus fidelis TaxID=2613842 RepID=A0A5N0TFZ1_9GAMM|nr:hypothetical protein [Marinihelvus fidelis]KAA9134073.1 hypothetical protein F3N42_00550 [Marinihelvus fidelis]